MDMTSLMRQEILINVTPQETRVAIVENGVVQEIHVERSQRRGIVGNIFKGKVSRVLPGMQAAFVDIGLDRAAFLHVSDIYSPEATEAYDQDHKPVQEDIAALVREGQQILVQVVKDPLGTKGARLTTNLTLAARFLVFLPGSPSVGVSVKIEDEDERERLKSILESLAEEGKDPNGYILRTAAEGVDSDALRADKAFLNRLWSKVDARAKAAACPSPVYEDLTLALRVIRDYNGAELERIRVDSRETFTKIADFCNEVLVDSDINIEHYPGERPIFDLYNIDDEIQRGLERRVDLKSGGYLVIDQTEAMTTVDVNTGAYVGHRNLEETIFKTNLEAAQGIARQLRLRNMGGIIIVDFIDMSDPEHQRQVLRALEKSLEKDAARTSVSEITSLGLVQMTRKRTRESLGNILCEPCPTCTGRGHLKSVETVCYEIFRDILREARQFDCERLMVLASNAVIERMIDEESDSVAELEAFIDKSIKFQAESLYTQEQFDVVIA